MSVYTAAYVPHMLQAPRAATHSFGVAPGMPYPGTMQPQPHMQPLQGYGMQPMAVPPGASRTVNQPAMNGYPVAAGTVASNPNIVTVACLGDSLTMWGYPNELQKMLDEEARISNTNAKWKVLDCGKGGSGIGTPTTVPYGQQPEFHKAISSGADIAIVMLGTNDAKQGVWECGGCEQGFTHGYQQLLRQLLSAMPRPSTVLVCIPPPLYTDGAMCMKQEIINGIFPQLIPKIGASMGLQVLDVFSELGGSELSKPHLFDPDGIHFEKPVGCTALAQFLLPTVLQAGSAKVQALGIRNRPPSPPPSPPKPPPPPPPRHFVDGKEVSAEEAAMAITAAQKPIRVGDLMPQQMPPNLLQQYNQKIASAQNFAPQFPTPVAAPAAAVQSAAALQPAAALQQPTAAPVRTMPHRPVRPVH